MSKVLIEIDTDNDAFTDSLHTEVARILHSVADRFEAEDVPSTVRDVNGNTVGTVSVVSDDPPVTSYGGVYFEAILNRLSNTSLLKWGKLKCPCGDPACSSFMLTHTGSEGRMSEADADFIINSRKDMLTLLLMCIQRRNELDRFVLHLQTRGLVTPEQSVLVIDQHLGHKRTPSKSISSNPFLSLMSEILDKVSQDAPE